SLPCFRRSSPWLIALSVLTFEGVAAAAGEACLRDTECGGAELCLDGTCDLDSDPPACAPTGTCEGWENTCVDGFCKTEGVVCRNPAGACWVRDGGGVCTCADGEGAGWSDGFNPDDPPQEPTDME